MSGIRTFIGNLGAAALNVRVTGLVLLTALILLRIWDPAPVERLRLQSFDLYQRLVPHKAETSPVVIVDIDEDSLAKIGQWPWPRSDIAKLIVNLVNAGAVVVGFDIVFAEPDRLSPANFAATAFELPDHLRQDLTALPDNDSLLAGVLAQANVVLGQSANHMALTRNQDRAPKLTPIAEFNGDPRPFLLNYKSVTRNTETLERAARGLGMFTLAPERDGIVRRVPAVLRVDESLYPTLTLEMLRLATGQQALSVKRDKAGGGVATVGVQRVEIPTDINGRIWVRFGPHRPDIYVPAAHILDGSFDKSKVAGKMVLVGTSASGLKDIRATPVAPAMPGVEIHAQLLETVLSGQYLTRPNIAIAVELAATLLLGLLLVLLIPKLGAARALLAIVVLIGGAFGASWYLFAEHLIMLDAAYPATAAFALFGILAYANYAREEAQKAQVRGAFGQYLSPDLVEQLADNPDKLKLGGEMREMTFLFCDVRGFTTISESYKDNPQGLTVLINRLLTPLTDVILANGGTIDKYMGDCIMAFWNAPLDVADHQGKACASALQMFKALETLNADMAAEAKAAGHAPLPIKVGIGLNTGECVVGNMGSEQRFDYSVLGDAVNLASRLEGQSKSYGVDTVVGEQTASAVKDHYAVLELDRIAVKGKKEAVTIYALLGGSDVLSMPAFDELVAANNTMLAAFRAANFDSAETALAKAAQNPLAPSGLYTLYTDRIAAYRASPPPVQWDGVYVATTK
ncbi:MAG: CHASE2 domain-containing protein [Alphaproteobacteria bacterium]